MDSDTTGKGESGMNGESSTNIICTIRGKMDSCVAQGAQLLGCVAQGASLAFCNDLEGWDGRRGWRLGREGMYI